MNLVELFETIKMVGIVLCVLFCLAWSIVYVVAYKGLSDEVIYPWKKEERRAAKKAAKVKVREQRRQAKRWRELEKQYR